MPHDSPLLKREKIFICLIALAVLSMSRSSSDFRAAESRTAAASVASKPCANCPPASGLASGSQAASGRRHLAKDARLKSRRTAEDMAQTEEKLGEVFAKLEEAAGAIPAETYDPQSIVDKVGSDVEPLFRWVRDNTFLVSYRGTLRGPIGVLMDRLGNSLDRALLLRDLLGKAGHEAKLAHGTLTEERAGEMLRKAAQPRPGLEASNGKPLSSAEKEAIEGYALEFGLDKKTLFAAVADEEKRRAGLARRISEREKELTPRLLDMVAKYREQSPDEERKGILEGFRDHWWVQVEMDSGMVDLDPSLPDAVPGKALAKCSETKQPDELDEDLYHKVVLRVVIEQWTGGRLKENEVLRREFRPSEILGQRMTFGHTSPGRPEAEAILRQKDTMKRFRDAALRQKKWTPVLRMGEGEEQGPEFNDTGDVSERSAEKKPSQGPRGGKSLLSAEWLEYGILSPGRPARKFRREVFDSIGPAGRTMTEVPRPRIDDGSRLERNLALLGRTEILPLVCQWSPDYLRYLADAHLLAGQETILSLYEEGALDKPDKVFEKLRGLDVLPAPLYRLARSRHGQDSCLASPNILSLHYLVREDGTGVFQNSFSIDIVDNTAGVVPGKADGAFRIRLAQGIRDSIRESVFSAASGEVDPLTRFYREAETTRTGWLVASAADDDSLDEAKLPRDFIARIRQATAAGDVVVFPGGEVVIDGRPVIRWWRIDPRTGDALVFGEQGWGQALSHYVQRVEQVTQMVDWAQLITDFFKCATIAAGAAVSAEPGKDWNAYFTCVQTMLCNQIYARFEDSCELETNWQNFMLKKLAGYLAGEFCDALMSDE